MVPGDHEARRRDHREQGEIDRLPHDEEAEQLDGGDGCQEDGDGSADRGAQTPAQPARGGVASPFDHLGKQA